MLPCPVHRGRLRPIDRRSRPVPGGCRQRDAGVAVVVRL